MKALRLICTLLFLGCGLPLFAQNPLVGTWERQTNTIRAIKIITPTHWAIFIRELDGGKLVRSHGGSYTLSEKGYIEQLDVASWDNKGDRSFTDYTYKVEGDKFYQSGTLILSDGNVTPIDEVWQKISSATTNPNYPALGAWYLEASAITGEDGRKENLTKATFTRFEIISPTHWLRITHRDHVFESAMGGTYTAEGNKAWLKVEFDSFAGNKIEKIVATEKVSRDKRNSTGMVTGPDGKTIASFDDQYRKAPGKVQQVKK